ncbi:hypothetical protein Tco_0980678, partial [Tanacetum coccineum]
MDERSRSPLASASIYGPPYFLSLMHSESAPNPTKVKTETRPRAAHEVPLLTATSNCVIDMEDVTGTSKSSRTPSVIEKSPLDFSNEDPPLAITKRAGLKI